MKEKLTIEHLTGYLPYDLKMISNTHGKIYTLKSCNKTSLRLAECSYDTDYFDVKPILYPLSTIKKNMTAGMVKHMLNCNFDVVREIWDLKSKRISLNKITYETYIVILKNHIDYQDLIEEGLAVDVNTIKK
jgi:hypothetical protein